MNIKTTQKIIVIGYARVSSSKQAQSGESLEDQEKAIRRYCEVNGYILYQDRIFKEPYSGMNTDRPVYNEILEILKKSRGKVNFKYFIFWDFDRLTRAGTGDYDKMWADVVKYDLELRDTSNIIQPQVNVFEEFGFPFEYSWAVSRPNEETEYARVERAKHDRRKILQRLIKPQISLTQAGYHIGRPDEGYINKKIFVDNKKKCIQSPNLDRSHFIVKMFELRAEGLLSDPDICKKLNSLGYRTESLNKWNKERTKVISKIGNNPLSVQHLQKIISRTTYCGVTCRKWTKYLPVKAQYDGLVSIELFNKANRGKVYIEKLSSGEINLLRNISIYSLKRKKYNPDFPAKGLLMCRECGKEMKASFSRGKSGKRFGFYHCTRNHKRYSVPKNEAEKSVSDFMCNLKFEDTFLDILEKVLIHQYREKEGLVAQESADINQHIANLERKKSELIASFPLASSSIVRSGIEEEVERVQKEIVEARVNRSETELKEDDITKFIAWAKTLVEHPAKMLEDIESPEELRVASSLIFDKLPTYEELSSGTPKLSLVFKLDRSFADRKDSMVTPRRVELRLPA